MNRKAIQKFFSRRRRLVLLALAGVAAATAWLVIATALRQPVQTEITGLVSRGDLRVTVLEGGVLRALRNRDIIFSVPGETTVLEIAAEGTIITSEDVAAGRVLVKLDDSQFREQLDQEEISLYRAESSLTEARENFEIQRNKNESDIRAADLKVEFGRMDLEKYLGKEITEKIMAEPAGYAWAFDHESLGGEALRKRKELQNAIELAREEISRARDKLDWTEKLEARGYATRAELEADQLALQRRRVEVEQAQTAYDLFARYDFPKETTKYHSDCEEALREGERVRANARSQLSQARSRLVNAEASQRLTLNRVNQIKAQIEGCVIRAPQPGTVVQPVRFGRGGSQRSPIEAGSQVWQFQTLLQLPDTSEMVVEMSLSEASVDRVTAGQPVLITVDAFPERRFTGRVTRVGLLPDAGTRWMNPDLNVYKVDVLIEGSDPDMRPGMSAQAEIMVDERRDVLMVPVSAVRSADERFSVTRVARGREEIVEVTLGPSNENFVEVTGGLAEGETVRLYAQGTVALGFADKDFPASDAATEPMPEPPMEPGAGPAQGGA